MPATTSAGSWTKRDGTRHPGGVGGRLQLALQAQGRRGLEPFLRPELSLEGRELGPALLPGRQVVDQPRLRSGIAEDSQLWGVRLGVGRAAHVTRSAAGWRRDTAPAPGPRASPPRASCR